MKVNSSRFGMVEVDPADTLAFPEGVLGLRECRQWLLLDDADNPTMAWLQSVERPDVALAVVSPRRFVPDYRLRVSRHEIEPLRLESVRAGQVLVILSRNERQLTINLKAPIVINTRRRLGRQVIANDELPLQHGVGELADPLRRSA